MKLGLSIMKNMHDSWSSMNVEEQISFKSTILATVVVAPTFIYLGEELNDVFRSLGISTIIILGIWIFLYLFCFGTAYNQLKKNSTGKKKSWLNQRMKKR